MKLPVSWLKEFAAVPADVATVAAKFAGCGFAVDAIDGDVLDLDVTANRPDCLSVLGLAREAATAFDLALNDPADAGANTGAAGGAPIKVSLADAGCGRYALAVADVKIGPAPAWIADRLIAAGVRPINNVVDITNYVMLELGQPMHAFDAARLAGPEIHVRRARAGEKLTTLDGVERALDETMLVIADRDRAVALAGVMGGATSEVSGGTTRIALESAWFRPQTVRATSRKLGLKTEASARFERGADISLPVRALRRALTLLQESGAGTASGGVTDVYPRPAEVKRVPLRRARIARLLGQAVPDADVERLLPRLGFGLTATAAGWDVTVPSFRVDVAREADLIEEVGRHWGLDRIPATFPELRTMPGLPDAGVTDGRLVRRLLCGAGVQEAVTFTFMEAGWAAPFAPADQIVPIANPLSEKFAVLRPSLLPGLIDSVAYSRRRESADVRLFEVGAVFAPAAEGQHVGWALVGSRGAHWSESAGDLGFPDTRGLAELVASAFGVAVEFSPDDRLTWLVNGRRARVSSGGLTLGWVGQSAVQRGVPDGDVIWAGELDLLALQTLRGATTRAIVALPRFPSIVRDLSIVVEDRLPAADVRATIRANAPSTLVSVREFDRYQGKGVADGHVSLSMRLTFRDAERTLTDADVQPAVDAIVAALARAHGAVLRGKN
ncbi:MAG TPA: phenylalanine--tRNA ligase subunit beta [Vicinamibacterales bacterium]|nr:phenylalanine--tRNA ligase subunit beta [Vicinamibacterales bacterium]